MRSFISLFFATVLAATPVTVSAEPRSFPNSFVCDLPELFDETIGKYSEQPFAQSRGIFTSIRTGQTLVADITIYLGNTGTFTIVATFENGVNCVVTAGVDFQPAIIGDQI